MNYLKTILILVIIGIMLLLILPKMCSEPIEKPDNSREIELQVQNDSLIQHSLELSKLVDSLYTRLNKIKPQMVARDNEINQNILKDSANALAEYRRAMVENDYVPQGGERLSYYEIGAGALLMAKIPKLQLTINIQDSIIFNKDLIISDKDYIIGGYKETVELKNESINYYQELYRKESSFWESRELWFGLGVVGTVAVVFLTGLAK